MKNGILSVFLFFVFFIALATVVSAGEAIKIGTGLDPATYGGRVVWADNSGSIHLYDLAAKQNIAISYLHASYPAIFGNKLAWHDENSGTPRIAIYDIPTADIYYVPQDVDAYSKPAIYGDRVVWGANGNVYEFDIPTLIQTRIASGNDPDIYGDNIAYAYEDRDGSGIAVYDMATKTTAKVPYFGVLGNPHIYGDKVIFSDSNTRWGNIVMYDLITKKVKVVTSDSTYSGDPENPDCGCDTGFHNEIYGDRIVYAKVTDDCLGKPGVYDYNITTGQSTLIYGVGNYVGTTPDISQNMVVWGYRDAYGAEASAGDIYAYEMSIPEPVATKKIAIIPARFSDTTSSVLIEDLKKRADLVVDYYNKQSYGKEHITYDIIQSNDADGWFTLPDTTQDFTKADKKIPYWEEALTLAKIEYIYTKLPVNKNSTISVVGYDTALVVFPTDFTPHAYSPGYAAVTANGCYGEWVHELGHTLYGLQDKAGNEPTEGDIGYWGIMGLGCKYNPPIPVIGFDRNKAGWLKYKDIRESDIGDSGNEYTISYLDDSALQNEGLLRLSTTSSKDNKYFIFEGRRIFDGVTPDPLIDTDYPLFYGADKGIVIYDVDGSDKIWRETAFEIWDQFNLLSHYQNTLNNEVTVSPGKSKLFACGLLKATCLSEGDKLKLKIEHFLKPINIKIWSITTARPLFNNLLSAPENSNLDVDLHIITSDGRRIGMDYPNDTYYNEIEGAVTSGNVLGGGPEWITVPEDINATAYVTLSPDLKTLILSDNSSTVEVSSTLTVYDENGNTKISEPISINITSENFEDQYPISLVDSNSTSSITNILSTSGTTWINWTWNNPTDPAFNHTEVYLDDTFKISTSTEYFNATDLQPETSYTLGTRMVDNFGNVSQTWVNSTVKTGKSSSSDGSSGGSGSSGRSGGGGAGGSPEPQSNVEAKELSQAFVTSGKSVKFDFPMNATPYPL